MSTSANAASTDPRQAIDRHYHLLRRLHSLSGIVPIGAFLLFHLVTNASIAWGALGKSEHGNAAVETFQHEVNFIHSLPGLLLVEILVLWLPIAFHAGVGMWFARTGRGNLRRYTWSDNFRYSLQRWSGYIGVLFIFAHVSSLRWGWTYGGLLPTFDGHHAASSMAAHLQEGSLGLALAFIYLVCVLALVFHFANGLWTAAITWGLTVSSTAQRRWGAICVGIGVGLSVASIAAVIGFGRLDVEKARAVEAAMKHGDGDAASIEGTTP